MVGLVVEGIAVELRQQEAEEKEEKEEKEEEEKQEEKEKEESSYSMYDYQARMQIATALRVPGESSSPSSDKGAQRRVCVRRDIASRTAVPDVPSLATASPALERRPGVGGDSVPRHPILCKCPIFVPIIYIYIYIRANLYMKNQRTTSPNDVTG